MNSRVRVTPKGQATTPAANEDEREDTAAQGWDDEPSDSEGLESGVEMPSGPATPEAIGATAWEVRLGSSMMTSKGQITVPAKVRERHGFKPGERVSFREVDGRVIVEPATASVRRLHGMLSDLWVGKPAAAIEEMKEAAAAGWAREPIEPR